MADLVCLYRDINPVQIQILDGTAIYTAKQTDKRVTIQIIVFHIQVGYDMIGTVKGTAKLRF
ncbi:MAG: hypothetical protein O0X96_05785 [Methanocorpusculum sp.]|nr:hypothetical protein [Methanocorpusculum sp.]